MPRARLGARVAYTSATNSYACDVAAASSIARSVMTGQLRASPCGRGIGGTKRTAHTSPGWAMRPPGAGAAQPIGPPGDAPECSCPVEGYFCRVKRRTTRGDEIECQGTLDTVTCACGAKAHTCADCQASDNPSILRRDRHSIPPSTMLV